MDSLRSNGLELELHPRRLSGPLIAGRHPRPWIALATQAPAFALLGVLVVLPALYTVGLAVWARPGLAAGCALLVLATMIGLASWYPVLRWPPTYLMVVSYSPAVLVAVAGVLLIGRDLTADGLRAYLLTVGWVLFAASLVLLALGIAWSTRKFRWLWPPLIVPFGISAFTAGIAFRLTFERVTNGHDLGSVGNYQLAFEVMLGAAFLWTWLGLLAGLFRAAIRAIEADPVRAGYVYHGTDSARMLRLWRAVRPVRLIAFLVVGVAAARVFDAILVAVPGSMQYRIDSATVYWWRTSTACEFPCGDAASYALPLAVVIGLVAVLAQAGIRAHQISWSATVSPNHETGRERMGFGRIAIVAVCVVVTWIPIGVLVHAALGGSGRSVGGELTRVRRDAALWHALGTTAWVATLATLIVVLVTVPVAHRLAALRTGFAARIVMPCLVVLTVLPAQMYLGPLHELINDLGLSGTRVPLILTHAAAGLPISILILRGALLAPAYTPAADALYGLAPRGVILTRVFRVVRPALGAVAVLEFIQVWNDFFIGLLISGAGASPWSLLLWGDAHRFDENSAQLAAGALVSAVVPVALLLAFWRRWLVPGLTGGALR